MKKPKIHTCPNCGSQNVATISKWLYFGIFTFAFLSTLFIGIIFPPFLVVSGALFLLIIVGLFIPTRHYCKECKTKFKNKDIKKATE